VGLSWKKGCQLPNLGNLHGVIARILQIWWLAPFPEMRQVEGKSKLQMVARFTINAVPALAVLDRGQPGETDGASWPAACFERPDGLAGRATPKEVVMPLNRKCHRAGGDRPVTPSADSRPPKA
jgi:hypothetical protein